MATSFGVWLGAIVTLAIYSFLYGENPAYRAAEHIFLGLAAANLIVMGFESIRTRAWIPLTQRGEVIWLGAIIGGLMLLTRWFKPIAWVSRMPLGFMMGVAAALSVRRAINAEFWVQFRATAALPWTTRPAPGATTFDNAIIIVTVLLSLAYFLFGLSERTALGGVVRKGALVGQYLMMIAFGASLGATVMARLSLVISRLQFLFGDWLGLL